jgi:hypothetical protein
VSKSRAEAAKKEYGEETKENIPNENAHLECLEWMRVRERERHPDTLIILKYIMFKAIMSM